MPAANNREKKKFNTIFKGTVVCWKASGDGETLSGSGKGGNTKVKQGSDAHKFALGQGNAGSKDIAVGKR